MRTRLTFLLVAPLVVASATRAPAQSSAGTIHDEVRQAVRRAMAEARELYQGNRGPEQSDRFSKTVTIARDGRVSLSNTSGDVVVTGVSGNEVTINAVKRARGDRDALDRVNIVVEEHGDRVEIRTDYGSFFRGSRVSVDYTVGVPAGVSLDVSSVSGDIKVTGVRGTVRLGTVSGGIGAVATPHIESARTVSGDMDLADVSTDGSLSITSVSGDVRVKGLKARGLDASTVSGDIDLRGAACERINARSVSGNFEYDGSLAKTGRYEVSSHSGTVRFMLSGNTGFELNTSSFSGSVRSEFPLTLGGSTVSGGDVVVRRGRGPNRGSLRATFGDASASLNLRTFSGDIVIGKR